MFDKTAICPILLVGQVGFLWTMTYFVKTTITNMHDFGIATIPFVVF
jgi:hypothetical protein